ncbi:MAG: hypothetical protein WC438_00795 [Candidatus Pacearchaeota archaeon]
MKKRILILLMTISLINLVHAEININYPNNVNYGEEFSVELELTNFSLDIYDVKIDVLGNSTRISKILNYDVWKSTNYYVNDIINNSQTNTGTFKLNITGKYNGIADIEIKLRDSKDKIYSFFNYSINVLYIEDEDNSEDNENDNSNDEENDEDEEEDIKLKISWDEEDIINGKEFEIELEAENLDKDYDIKVWIADEENNVLSDRYDEENKEWKSGRYYLNDFFDSGDETKKVKLRIRKEYLDFNGDAEIFLKLRDSEEISEDIEILEKEDNLNEGINNNSNIQSYSYNLKEDNDNVITGNVIMLGNNYDTESQDIKSEKNVIYESKNELIKKYSIFGFALLCVLLSVLVITRKL